MKLKQVRVQIALPQQLPPKQTLNYRTTFNSCCHSIALAGNNIVTYNLGLVIRRETIKHEQNMIMRTKLTTKAVQKTLNWVLPDTKHVRLGLNWVLRGTKYDKLGFSWVLLGRKHGTLGLNLVLVGIKTIILDLFGY